MCDALLAAGDKTTVRRVQAELGGGSNTTILNHLRRWQDTKRAAQAATATDGILTDALRASLVNWAQEREALAKEAAEQRLFELEELYTAAKEGWEAAEARIAVLEQSLGQAVAEGQESARKLEHALAAAQAKSAAAEQQVVQLQETMAREQKSIESSRLVAAEGRGKAEAAAETARSLAKENAELRSELKALQEIRCEAEQRAAVAEERARSRDEMLAQLRSALEAQQKAAAEQQGGVAQANKELTAALRELAICQGERAALQLERDRAKKSKDAPGADRL